MSAEISANPLESLQEHVEHLQHGLGPLPVAGTATGHGGRVGPMDVVLSTYTLWFFIAIVVVLVVVFVFKKKQVKPTEDDPSGLVPKGKFVNAAEFLVEFVQKNMIDTVIHGDGRQYFPLIATVFTFILISNFMGLVPSFKTGTGVVGGTLAISFFVFLYFNYVGIKKKGFIKYFAGLVPHGVPGWIGWLVWIIEFISMLLRPITQALRLFANMLAGHLVLGIFALLTSLFVMSAIEYIKPLTALPSIAWFALLVAMYALEVVVAAVQAYVFSLLTAVYINSSVGDH